MASPGGRDPPTSYDKLIKSLLRRFPADFPTLLFGRRPVTVTPVPTGLSVVAERLTDHLQHVQFEDGEPALLHLEFQARGQRRMPNRVNEYLALILGVLERPGLAGTKLACAVIYLDPDDYTQDPGYLRYEGLLGLRVQVEYTVLKLWEQDPNTVLELGLPGLYPFLPLLRGRPEELVLRSRSKILTTPETIAPLEAKRELLLVLAGLAGKVIQDKAFLQSLLAEIGIMDKNYFFDLVREEMRAVMLPELTEEITPKLLQKLEPEVRERVRQEVEQEIRQEVRQEVEQQLLRELEQGRLAEARRAVLQALRVRFGEPPQRLADRMERMADLVVLESLLGEAILCTDTADFVKRSALLEPDQ